MKKRLLSAALALAMVLTLIPATVVPAFAANTYAAVEQATTAPAAGTPDAQNPVGKSFTLQTATSYDNKITKEAGKWYWSWTDSATSTVHTIEAAAGFLVGSAWYPDEAAYLSKVASAQTVPTNITLIGSGVTFTKPFPTTFSIDLNGQNFAINSLDACGPTSDAAMTNLTVTDKQHPVSGAGTLTLGATSRTTYDAKKTGGLTLTATNVGISAINLVGRANTVTLHNCDVTGAVSMNGASKDNNGKDSWARQSLTADQGSTFGDKIGVVGDGSTISLTSATGTAGVSAATGAVTLEGNGTSVTINGASNIGNVLVQNNVQTGATADGAVPNVYVYGGKVASIKDTNANTKANTSVTLERRTNNIEVGDIEIRKGSVSVNTAKTGDITVPAGSLTVAGNNNTIGTMILGGTDATTLSITATNSTFTGLTVTNNNLNITSWPATRDNYYGTLSMGDYSKGQIKGGTFAAATGTALSAAANMDWVDSNNLQFIVPVKSGSPNYHTTGDVALYDRTELTEAISSIAATTAAVKGTDDIIVIGQGGANAGTLQLNFGGNPWAYIKYDSTTGLSLPTRINNTGVAKWIVNNGTSGLTAGDSFVSGTEQAIPAAGQGKTLILTSTDTTAEVTEITGITGTSNGTVDTGNVKVTLTGNNIHVSGAVVPGSGGYADITVDLNTDVIDSAGNPVVLSGVVINWDFRNNKVTFGSIPASLASYGVMVQDNGSTLVLNRGTGAKYTVSASLSVSAKNLELASDSKEIKVTFGGKLANWSPEAKKDLIDTIEGDGEFTWASNRAMLEAINAAQATITSTTSVDNWIANAKDYIWKNGYTSPDGTTLTIGKHTGSYKDYVSDAGAAKTDVDKIKAAFDTAYIVPYLLVNITDYDANAKTLTATLTPYYRVDVSKAKATGYDVQTAYTVQAGKTLGALTGDMSTPVTVNLGLTPLNTQQMHQDGKYVYTGAAGVYSIYHAGTTGLGTVEINGKEGLVEISASTIAGRSPAHGVMKYDTLQAAIDDTKPGVTQQNTTDGTAVTTTYDTITINGDYKGSGDFTMTGYARKVAIIALGDTAVKCTSQNVDTLDPSGYTYMFQLKKDTAPTGGNITIASATGGSASVNANPAAAGQTVTVTLSASAGYSPSGVTVKTASGTNVSVSGSGSTYTFTMPSGTVTVTPSFSQNQQTTLATVTVSNPSRGSGTASTSVGSNKVAPGTTVTVTTTPASGQRTMGLSVTGATAYRSGVNSFSFTVPSGVTNVVVTPTFDTNNNTVFSDVWSSEYYSPAVAWAVGSGITKGTGDYTFGPTDVCTREDMVTFLYRAAGEPAIGNVSNPFWDVQPGIYYYNAVMWAVQNGITNGVSSNQFGVGQVVSRAQAVTFLYRAAGSPSASTNSGFYDVPSNEYYARAVSWANSKGVTNGDGSTTKFNPNEACSRGQIVTFLYRDRNNIRA